METVSLYNKDGFFVTYAECDFITIYNQNLEKVCRYPVQKNHVVYNITGWDGIESKEGIELGIYL